MRLSKHGEGVGETAGRARCCRVPPGATRYAAEAPPSIAIVTPVMKLEADARGSGPALLFLRGVNGAPAWLPFMEALSRDFVIVEAVTVARGKRHLWNNRQRQSRVGAVSRPGWHISRSHQVGARHHGLGARAPSSTHRHARSDRRTRPGR